jgi:2-polyprenyl-6-methoxyphenol hydroxylase-like FAD-dependent oxidoreductase
VRLGLTATGFDQHGDGVGVTFSDGTRQHYDLVVGADGLNSATRRLIGIDDVPVPTGMAIWRAPVPRPSGVEHTQMIYGGACFIAGCCPTGPDTAYAYLVERNRDRATIAPSAYADEMLALAKNYGGPWPEIQEALTDPELVNYTWFDRLLVDGPWHRGRVVLVGDAAHACPPTLAQGAAMSLEDSQVLAELLAAHDVWDDAVLTEYRTRRYERVRTVVDASVQLGQWLLDGVRDADVPGLMGRTMAVLAGRP